MVVIGSSVRYEPVQSDGNAGTGPALHAPSLHGPIRPGQPTTGTSHLVLSVTEPLVRETYNGDSGSFERSEHHVSDQNGAGFAG